jgi:hypothetical protein
MLHSSTPARNEPPRDEPPATWLLVEELSERAEARLVPTAAAPIYTGNPEGIAQEWFDPQLSSAACKV